MIYDMPLSASFPELSALDVFASVIRHGSFGKAAKAHQIAQPSVTSRMRNLERQLGVTLLRRDGRSVVPTDAGQRAYETLSPLVESWRELQVDLRRLGGRPDEVTIAVPFGTARVLIPVLVRHAARAVPDITVNVVERASPESLVAVGAGDYAMALVYPDPATSESPATTTVAHEVLCAVGRPDLLGSAADDIELSELASMPLLLSESTWGIRRIIDTAFVELGRPPRVVREVGIADALMAFALEGDGVTILPRSNVVRELELGTLAAREIVGPTIGRSLALATSPELPPAIADELVDLFRASLTATQPSAGWQVH